MAQEKRDNRVLIKGDEARNKLLEGARDAYDTVTSTYGPKGRNVWLEKPFGRPLLTRDGVTVSKDVYFSDRAKNMGAQAVMEAAETTNRIAGDGTTATVALSYNLMKHGVQAIAAGVHPMKIRQTLQEDSYILLKELAKLSKPIKKGQLQQIATVSSGDPLLGQLIAEAIEYVGADGGIITEKSHVEDVEREYVDGYFLQSGFTALSMGKKEIVDPMVIVSTRRISSTADANQILTTAAQAKGIKPEDLQRGNVPRMLLIGDIEDTAYNFIVNAINQGLLDAIILKTPSSYGAMGKHLLEDIAIYAGAEPIRETTSLREISGRHVGTVDKVVSSKTEATLFADNTGETIQDRIAEIKSDIEAETTSAIRERLKDRVAKLEGKIALFRIGGATDGEKEEKEFRIEDAILASRAAADKGIVAGGGITLLELSKLDISPIYRDALQGTFKQLLLNAGLPAEVKLAEALKSEKGHGYNLRENDKLVDMVEAGILDPTLVLEQVVKNSTSVAGNALTADTLVIFEDREVS